MKNEKQYRSWPRAIAKLLLPTGGLDQHVLAATLPALLLATVLYTLQHGGSDARTQSPSKLIARDDKSRCQIDPSLNDVCTFVQKHCSDFDSDGLIPYLRTFYCAPKHVRPYLLVVMLTWLMVLFASMATAAGDYLAIDLEVLVSIIGISENLAGVTIFAFGNGSSDLFSTIAAMNVHNGSLAISELFGAAAFITTVVLGLVAITQPFSVLPSTFVGEVIWFMISAGSLVAFLADGELVLAECLGIVGLYLAFVLYAVLRPNTQHHQEPITAQPSTTLHEIESEEPDSVIEQQSDETSALLNSHSSDNTHSNRDDEQPGGSSNQVTTELANLDHAETDSSNFDEDSSVTGDNESQPKDVTILQSLEKSLIGSFSPLTTWHEQSVGQKVLTCFSLPLLIPVAFTTPIAIETDIDETPRRAEILLQNTETASEASETASEQKVLGLRHPAHEGSGWTQYLARNWTLCVQLLLGLQLLAWVFVSQTQLVEPTSSNYRFSALLSFAVSTLTTISVFVTQRSETSSLRTASTLFVSIFGFIVATVWIYLIATEVVSLLTTLGFILSIPNAILGAVIFAIGNSSNDLIANTAVARRGYPVLAASACFGGPMMNMLLGIGGGGLVQVLKQSAGHERKYSFNISPTLFLSAGNLLIGLAVTLVYAFCNSWRLDKRYGVILMSIWGVFTAGNIAMSAAGI